MTWLLSIYELYYSVQVPVSVLLSVVVTTCICALITTSTLPILYGVTAVITYKIVCYVPPKTCYNKFTPLCNVLSL